MAKKNMSIPKSVLMLLLVEELKHASMTREDIRNFLNTDNLQNVQNYLDTIEEVFPTYFTMRFSATTGLKEYRIEKKGVPKLPVKYLTL